MDRDRKRKWWTLFLLVASGIAILIGYYVGMDRGPEKEKVLEKETPVKERTAHLEPGMDKNILKKEETVSELELEGEEQKTTKNTAVEDHCVEINAQVEEFFQYLDTKDYIKHSGENISSFVRFKNILRRLSIRPPDPAGEGTDPLTMNKNIFYLYRALDGVDIIMMKDVLQNEADTIEINMQLFYTWLMLGDRCPDKENIRPSRDETYRYAGFFLNTIGGRAYLFRRSANLRLLISYYSLLIIHKADKDGFNRFGIDAYPEIGPLLEEIQNSPDLRFKDEYVQELRRIQTYYHKRGRK